MQLLDRLKFRYTTSPRTKVELARRLINSDDLTLAQEATAHLLGLESEKDFAVSAIRKRIRDERGPANVVVEQVKLLAKEREIPRDVRQAITESASDAESMTWCTFLGFHLNEHCDSVSDVVDSAATLALRPANPAIRYSALLLLRLVLQNEQHGGLVRLSALHEISELWKYCSLKPRGISSLSEIEAVSRRDEVEASVRELIRDSPRELFYLVIYGFENKWYTGKIDDGFLNKLLTLLVESGWRVPVSGIGDFIRFEGYVHDYYKFAGSHVAFDPSRIEALAPTTED